MIDQAELAALLPEHLVKQRWAGASEREITSVQLEWCDPLEAEAAQLVWVGATARFKDGGEQTYQLFLGGRPWGEGHDFLHGKDREIVGTVDEVVIYDALVDPDLAVAVLHLVDPGREVEVRRPLVLEHSNSSVVYDEAVILKVLRKVQPGRNPDVEIPRVLAARGVESVMAPIAALEREGTDLAVLRTFLLGANEGWQLAHTSVRDVLASRLRPEECGGDFAPDSERLGAMLAELHLGLATAFGVDRGAPEVWAREMRDHLAALSATAGPALPFEPATVTGRFDRLTSVSSPGARITVHGDLHLAQVMLADTGWYVLDWEGEPARRRDERFTRSSPLRDVAGMLRSFHYAAATGLSDWDEGDEELVELAAAWEQRNREAFLGSYRHIEGIDALLPGPEADLDVVLASFELDKAVYEVGYELGHRPELVGIPAQAVERLLA